jgi:hypothetical protein
LRLVYLACGSRLLIGCEGFNSETSPRSAGGTVGGTDEPHSGPAVKRLFRRTLLQRHDRRWTRRKVRSGTRYELEARCSRSSQRLVICALTRPAAARRTTLYICEGHLDKRKFRVEACAQIAVRHLRLLDSRAPVHCTPEEHHKARSSDPTKQLHSSTLPPRLSISRPLETLLRASLCQPQEDHG